MNVGGVNWLDEWIKGWTLGKRVRTKHHHQGLPGPLRWRDRSQKRSLSHHYDDQVIFRTLFWSRHIIIHKAARLLLLACVARFRAGSCLLQVNAPPSNGTPNQISTMRCWNQLAELYALLASCNRMSWLNLTQRASCHYDESSQIKEKMMVKLPNN